MIKDIAYPDCALILAGHGSRKESQSALSTLQHAECIRAMNLFAEVESCFFLQAPFYGEILDQIKSPKIVVVPNLASGGFICQSIIPTEMKLAGPITVRGNQTIFLSSPVGEHPKLLDIAAKKIWQFLLEQHIQPANAQVLLVAHGHSDPRKTVSAQQTKRFANDLSGRIPDLLITATFLEETPFIDDWRDLTNRPNILLLPYMIANGLHGTRDIPAHLEIDTLDNRITGIGKYDIPLGPYHVSGKKLWYSRALGSEKDVSRLIVELAREQLS